MTIDRDDGNQGGGVVGATMSFDGLPPANLYARRGLNARVKVNSTRQGTPRPMGPWSPGYVARAADTKSNELDSDSVVDFSSPVDRTMEHRGLPALVNATAPLTNKPQVPRFSQAGRTPTEAVPLQGERKTAPVPADAPAMSTAAGQVQELFARARAKAAPAAGRLEAETVAGVRGPQPAGSPAPQGLRAYGRTPEATVAIPLPRPVEDHRLERVVALLLFMAMLGLVHLIWTAP